MNESTLTRLKILVERAVRPLRASAGRKYKMREELLAHVSAVFEEETARLGDERAALELTVQRFGDPAELTGQLRESVPARDAVLCFWEDLFSYGSSNSTLRRAGWQALVVGLLVMAVSAVFLLAGPLFVAQWRTWPKLMVAATGMLGLALITSGLMFLGHCMWHALHGPSGHSWLQACLVGAGSCLLVPGVLFGVCLALSGDRWTSLLDGLWVLPLAAVLTPLVVAFIAHGIALEIQADQQWSILPIEGDST